MIGLFKSSSDQAHPFNPLNLDLFTLPQRLFARNQRRAPLLPRYVHDPIWIQPEDHVTLAAGQ